VKKVASVLLLALFLFNVGGYYVIFWGLRQHHNYQFNAKLDANQYSSDQTVELKFHLSLPYPSLQYEYERVNGKFEHNGEFYKLVKKQLRNDTLYVVCIRDKHEERIVETMNEVENLASDVPASDKDISFLTKLLKDFEAFEETSLTQTAGWVQPISHSIGEFPIRSADLAKQSPPPKV
jgi:hypothetical protein